MALYSNVYFEFEFDFYSSIIILFYLILIGYCFGYLFCGVSTVAGNAGKVILDIFECIKLLLLLEAFRLVNLPFDINPVVV